LGAVRGQARVELVPQKRLEAVAPAIVRLKVEKQADDGKRARVPLGQSVELFVQLIDGWHAASVRNADAIDQSSTTASMFFEAQFFIDDALERVERLRPGKLAAVDEECGRAGHARLLARLGGGLDGILLRMRG